MSWFYAPFADGAGFALPLPLLNDSLFFHLSQFIASGV